MPSFFETLSDPKDQKSQLKNSVEHIELTRTQVMHQVIAKKGWVVNFGGKAHLPLDVPHLVLDGNVTDFVHQPIALVDGNPEAEIITLDPKSPRLNDRYKEFLKKYNLKKHSDADYEKTVISKLDAAIQFIQSELGGVGDDKLISQVQDFVDKAFDKIKYGKQKDFQGVPVIPLEDFIGKKGVCRHRALYSAFMLGKMIEDGILPAGKVYTICDSVKKGAHAWVIYKVKDTGKIYSIDPMSLAYAIDVTDGKNVLALGFMEKHKKRIIERYKTPATIKNENLNLISQIFEYESRTKTSIPNLTIKYFFPNKKATLLVDYKSVPEERLSKIKKIHSSII